MCNTDGNEAGDSQGQRGRGEIGRPASAATRTGFDNNNEEACGTPADSGKSSAHSDAEAAVCRSMKRAIETAMKRAIETAFKKCAIKTAFRRETLDACTRQSRDNQTHAQNKHEASCGRTPAHCKSNHNKQERASPSSPEAVTHPRTRG